jgi:YfiH family protein
MNLSPPFYELGEHIAIDLPGARAVFTTRRGGFSRGPFESLNLGRLTHDNPETVGQNREKLAGELCVRLAMIRQVHGSEVVAARPDGALREADGQLASEPGVAPMVLTADCLPIAIAGEGVVAILHAGWRGLAGGIVEAGISALRRLGVAGPLTAAIGPGAGPCCYEVGEEVHAAFPDQPRNGRNLDLKAVARRRLEQAGADAVYDVCLCTICSERSLFFSHRRDRGVTGRQAGIVWLT